MIKNSFIFVGAFNIFVKESHGVFKRVSFFSKIPITIELNFKCVYLHYKRPSPQSEHRSELFGIRSSFKINRFLKPKDKTGIFRQQGSFSGKQIAS